MEARNETKEPTEEPTNDVTEESRPSRATHESPIGPLTVVASSTGLRSVHFSGESPRPAEAEQKPIAQTLVAQVLVEQVRVQLDAYFAGELEAFDLALDLRGTPLQRLVWEQLLQIPYGETTSYGELARRIDERGYPEGLEAYKRPRVVGAAIARNPIPVIVGCHRVIGADGSLTGYRGGLERKRRLLELEGRGGPARARRSSRQLALL